MSSIRWTPKGDTSLFDRVIPEHRWSYAACRLEFFEEREEPLIEVLRSVINSAKL